MTAPDPLTLARREEAEAAARWQAAHRSVDLDARYRATLAHLVAVTKRILTEQATPVSGVGI